MITHLTWVLGDKMPEIDTSTVTCHARDDISIDSLINELLDLIVQRLTMMLKNSVSE